MDVNDRHIMEEAIRIAKACSPVKESIPLVGAVIAIGKDILAVGQRGTGKPGDDEHAEFNAFNAIKDRSRLGNATIYTTLEPCTPGVRSDPLTCCTALIKDARVKKVFIGILDPNQGVTGKGLWELQTHGVEVELFPHELAEQIRTINHEFIRTQSRLGIKITKPMPQAVVRTYDQGGKLTVKGTFLNPPGQEVFAFVRGGTGHWSPQPYPLKQIRNGNEWEVTVHFGSYGPHTIYIIKTNELGRVLVDYYWKVVRTNKERSKQLLQKLGVGSPAEQENFLRSIIGEYPSIEMGTPPKGLEVQDCVEVIVENPPNQKT